MGAPWWPRLAAGGLPESGVVGGAAGLLLVGVFLTVFFFRLGDFDCWWHLATGRLIVEQRAVPTTDPFSWTIAGRPWLDFEWLSQLVLYGCHAAGGLGGLLFYKAALATVLFASLLAYARWLRTPAWIVFPVLLAGFMVLREYLVERPQMFTFCLLAAEWVLIERFRQGLRGLELLPVLFLAWANLHGGACLIGFALLALLLASRLATLGLAIPGFAVEPALERPASGRLLLATLASAAATLVNPHGFRIYTHAVATVSDPGSKSIMEWLPPEAGDFAGMLGVFLALLVLAAVLARRRDPCCWSMVILLVAMAFTARRHIPLMTIAGLCAILGSYGRALPSGSRQGNTLPGRWALSGALALWLTIAIALLLFLRFDRFRERIGWGTVELPQGAADFLLREHPRGQLFNTYDFGGYLIWRLWPTWKVFIDGRNVEYGPEHVLLVWHWYEPRNWTRIQQRYDPDLAIVGQGAGYQCKLLDDDPTWALLYWDDTSLLYAKRGRGNDDLIERTRYRCLRPNQTDFAYLTPLLSDASTREVVLEELRRSTSLNAALMRGTALKLLGRWSEAIAAYEEAHRLKEEAAEPCASLGIVHQRLGDAVRARQWYLAAIERAPRDAQSWSNLGVLEYESGDRPAARRAWTKALAIEPHLESARANLQQLQSGR